MFGADFLGRRRAMMVVCVPYAVAWFLMFKANSIVNIFIANSLLGFGIGLMEAPIMTYVLLCTVYNNTKKNNLIYFILLNTNLLIFLVTSGKFGKFD